MVKPAGKNGEQRFPSEKASPSAGSGAVGEAGVAPLIGLELDELTARVQRAGFEAFRAKQVFHWIYQRDARAPEEMRNLPRRLREWLTAENRMGGAVLDGVREGADGSMKLLWALEDGERVEGVLMPEKNRWTLCVSTQAGCALGCRFCVTGAGGLRRDLATGEIAGQVLEARRLLAARDAELTNLVFMGMGEPLLNPGAVLPALRLIVSPQAIKISPRRVTVSTAGLTAGVRALAEADPRVKLAVSLNAPDQERRERLMPVARANPLDELLDACRFYARRANNRITLEYVLLAGVNDAPADARALARVASGLPCKINLIPFNPAPGIPFERPSDERVNVFRDLLLERNFTVAVRYSKGLDVDAACGQLALGRAWDRS